MDFIKSWIELVREIGATQFWWFIGVFACAADWWLLARFDTGLLNIIGLREGLLFKRHSLNLPLEIMYFSAVFLAIWLYLLPLVIVPTWKKIMFEFNYRTSSNYRNSASLKEGWHYLGGVMSQAAIDGNDALYKHCELRQNDLVYHRFQLTCALGMLIIGLAAPAIDPGIGNSLIGHAIQAWEGLTKWWQAIIFFAMMPGIFVLFLIISDQRACFDPYIYLPERGV